MTQFFLKLNGINYKMFTGWDIFTFSTGLGGGYGNNHRNGGQFFEDRNYENINNNLLKDTFLNSTYLWDMIDFDNFWMFNNDKIKFGGLVQWVENNFTKQGGFRAGTPFDFHPNEDAQNAFCHKILIPMIEESN